MAADGIASVGLPRLPTVRATAEVIDRFRAALAARIWHGARPAADEHPYLARKGVAPHGWVARVAGVAKGRPVEKRTAFDSPAVRPLGQKRGVQ